MNINCILINNEKKCCEQLRSNLDKFSEFRVIGEANTAIDGIKLIEENKVDLVILDMDLPDLTGVELMNSLVSLPKTIVTALSSEYAIDCFELNVIDYILRPISTQRFIKALNKFRNSFLPRDESVVKHINQESSSDIFKLEINRTIYNLHLNKITFIESMREYVKIHFLDEEPIVLKYVLSRLEEQLPKILFLRIHKSYIISIKNIKLYTSKYIETLDKKIPIGSFYRKDVLAKLF